MHLSMQTFGISICCILVIVNGQLNQPQSNQYIPNARRRYVSGDPNGFSASSSSSPSGDFIRFPDSSNSNTAAVNLIRADSSENHLNGRNRTNADDTNVQSDKIFVSNFNAEHEETCTSDCIPLNVSRAMDSYEAFFESLDEDSQNQFSLISPRSSIGDVERSNAPRAVPANCIPEMTVVPLKLEDEHANDSSVFLFPSCTRVKRCGGCCNSNLLACQPIEFSKATFQVFKSQHVNGRTKLMSREVIEVEEHTRCKCDCRTKSHHCNQYQRYDENSCSCICTNIEDQKKCYSPEGDPKKIWDSGSCSCKCREVFRCTTDTYFDLNSCSCVETPGYQHTKMVERRRLITKPFIYIPQTSQITKDDRDSITESDTGKK